MDIIFILPPLILILVALAIGGWQFSKRGAKAAAVAIIRTIVYGGFALFILFIIWVALYYSGSGH